MSREPFETMPDVMDAKQLAEQGKSAAEIKQILEEVKQNYRIITCLIPCII